jgi:hypothetical protein
MYGSSGKYLPIKNLAQSLNLNTTTKSIYIYIYIYVYTYIKLYIYIPIYNMLLRASEIDKSVVHYLKTNNITGYICVPMIKRKLVYIFDLSYFL